MNNSIDYTNIYGTEKYNEYLKQNFLYLEDEKYFEDEEIIKISDGFSLMKKNYLKEEGIRRIYMSRSILRKNGETIYSFITVDGHHNSYNKLIYHKNGHRYYPFHTDLYGISYIDVDTLEVYNYIPRGYADGFDGLYGESFIITNIFYDSNTNLVAYEGCYWASTSDVMVGDFSNPLNFTPRLISVHELLDSEYEEFDDVDFYKWNENSLSVKIDGNEVRDVELGKLKLK